MTNRPPSPSFHDEIELWRLGNSDQAHSRSVSELSIDISSAPTTEDHADNANTDRQQIRRKPVASPLKPRGEASYEAVEPVEGFSPRNRWTPIPLRTVSLATFAVVFAAFVLALELVYQQSERMQGLSTVSTNLRYLWTYGPTAGESCLLGVNSTSC